MAVLQFGFDPATRTAPHHLANHAQHQVVYTGTHDHDTLRGWYELAAGRAGARRERSTARAWPRATSPTGG